MKGSLNGEKRPPVKLTARPTTVLLALVFIYLLLILPFANYMQNKPFVEKVGIVPAARLMQIVSADQKQLVGELLVLKVLMYFGGLMEVNSTEFLIPPDYPAMSRLLHAASKLDPYNMDIYYFGQSILVWDVGQIELANNLLDYGMKYRDWDWSLPFFAGFNHAYFLKNYEQAASYYRLAGELSDAPLFRSLAGRYMHESGQTALALSYLSTMSKTAKNPAIKKVFATRMAALKEVQKIEMANQAYREDRGSNAASITALIEGGYFLGPLVDPYGGEFYIDPDGKVKTTSNFSFAKKQQ